MFISPRPRASTFRPFGTTMSRLIGAQYERISLPLQVDGCFLVGTVGVVVTEGAHCFVAGHFDFSAIVAVNGQVAIDVIEDQPRDAVGRTAGGDAVIENAAQYADGAWGTDASQVDAVRSAPDCYAGQNDQGPEHPRAAARAH